MSGSTPSTPPRSRPPGQPWRPAAVHVYGVYPRERAVLERDTRTGERKRNVRKRYDVRFRVDAYEFRYGFDQKGWADEFVQQLRREFVEGKRFDPKARRFVPEAQPNTRTVGLSFYDFARQYVAEQWHRWEPSTRRNAQRDFAMASTFLLRAEAPPLGTRDRLGLFESLRRVAFIVPEASGPSEQDRQWCTWAEQWSLPLSDVTDAHLREFLDVIRSEGLDGKKRRLAPSSVNRTRAVLRGAFTQAYKRRLIDWDPWQAVAADPMPDHEKVDPDLVMAPSEIRALAEACGRINPRSKAFVLVQGFCGLRPGEAIEVRRRDIGLNDDVPTITVRGTYSALPARYFLEGESRRRPLKGRGPKATRTVPIPSELVPLLRTHLQRFLDPGRDNVVFTNTKGGRINTSNFRRDLWSPARAEVFEEGSPLLAARLHDLRHSAVTTWLNAGVPLKTAQLWSGHKTLSVLLDTYLGVMRGDEATARQRLEEALRMR